MHNLLSLKPFIISTNVLKYVLKTETVEGAKHEVKHGMLTRTIMV